MAIIYDSKDQSSDGKEHSPDGMLEVLQHLEVKMLEHLTTEEDMHIEDVLKI